MKIFFAEWKSSILSLLGAVVLMVPQIADARPVSEIMESGVLRACVPTANPPDGEVTPEGCTGYCQYKGVIGEMVAAFAHSLDLKPEYWVSSWDGLFHNEAGQTIKEASYTPRVMAEEQCDMIGAVMVSLDWRRRKMEMECFLPSRMMIVAHKDMAENLREVSDLGGLTVSVEQSMSLHTWVDEQNAGPLKDNPIEIDFRPYDESIPAVDRGDADFTVVSVLDALYHTRNLVKDSSVSFAVGPIDEGCWGYRKGDAEMGALIEGFFREQTADPGSELSLTWERYYGMSFANFVRLVSTIE